MKARRFTAIATLVAALCGVSCVAMPTVANAGSSRPLPPTGAHVVKVSASSFTVTTRGARNARRYRLFASTTRSDMAVAQLGHTHRSALSSTPTVSVTKLPFSTTPYYYRVEAINGRHTNYSATIGTASLKPSAPTNLVVTSSRSGTSLTWDSGAATGYIVTQATNAAMTQNVTSTSTQGPDRQFTPAGLTSGTTYYFKVAALNGTTPSSFTPVVSTVAAATDQAVSIMTYNVLEDETDGKSEGDGIVAPWSQRVLGAAALIKQASPDVVAIEEAADWTGAVRGDRMIDTLVSALGGEYTLANTEIAPSQPHYLRTGDYILFKTSVFDAVGTGDHWSLGGGHYAVYQVLADKATGAQFLMVGTHLIQQLGAAGDSLRASETASLLSQAKAYDTSGLPIIYAGDFNSDNSSEYPTDAPAVAMRSENISDAFDVAPVRTNAQYDSVNGYYRSPPAFGHYIDYVFAPPGVAVTSWALEINLVHGEFSGVIPSDHNPVVVNVEYPY